ncbi:hypothetical protein [Robertmurraya siralis]|uniref:hypothetical protein n=1 Tax=Robertmurraya siralis TaxID=77777 RepID=UPI0010F89319|nr:hypothetical protein [Robertmurraya siralis]
MNIEIFKLLKEYNSLENDLYFNLTDEIGLEPEKVDGLLDGFTDLYERTLRLGKYLDEESYVGKETHLTKKYNSFDSYTRLNVIYMYENGFALCKTTSGLIELVPKEYLFEFY